MKKFILILTVLLIGYSAAAQVPERTQSRMKYKDLKELYDYKDYTKDMRQDYRPGGVGVASYLIPGLGEMICGEGWRGAAFMGGWLACHFVTLTGVAELSDAIYYSGIIGAQALRIISCVDAIRVAKVKNMYSLYPSMTYIKTADGIQPTAGLTFAFRF